MQQAENILCSLPDLQPQSQQLYKYKLAVRSKTVLCLR